MYHSRGTSKEALKQSYAFQNKAKIIRTRAKGGAFKCSAEKLYTFVFLSYVCYALEFSL